MNYKVGNTEKDAVLSYNYNANHYAPPWETGKPEPPHNRVKGKRVYHYADE